MKRMIFLISILVFSLISVSGCSSGLNNKRLKDDILSLQDLALINNVKEMTIIDKIETTTSLEYKLSTILEAYTYTATVDIKLDYSKKDGVWTLSDHQVDIVSISAKNDPSVTQVVSLIIKPISESLLNHWGNGYQPEYKLTSSTGSKESGAMTIVVSEEYSDDYYSVGVDYALDAVFDFKTGWNFTLKDWVYTETMKWAGTYNITWTRSEPGYPSGQVSQYFVEGDKIIGLKIEGTGSLKLHMDKTKEIQNNYVITFTFKDKDYRVLPTFGWSVSNLRFKLDSDLQSDSLELTYAVPKEESDNRFSAFAEFISGELVKIN